MRVEFLRSVGGSGTGRCRRYDRLDAKRRATVLRGRSTPGIIFATNNARAEGIMGEINYYFVKAITVLRQLPPPKKNSKHERTI